jgi:hypothetical protein
MSIKIVFSSFSAPGTALTHATLRDEAINTEETAAKLACVELRSPAASGTYSKDLHIPYHDA